MATDTFTCSRCGQVSYYRDGSYLFGQQIVCARCYAAQAAPPVPVAGLAPQPGVPAAYPAAPGGFPGAPAAYAPQAPGFNTCGLLGFSCAILSVLCMLFFALSARGAMGEFVKLMEEIQQNPNDQAANQKKMEEWAKNHEKEAGAMTIGICGPVLFILAGLILSIIGVCLSNVRKGLAIAGLILNGLMVLSPCLLICAASAFK